ncbi:MAG: helix-turn-helix domain protein [Microviridae sp.]|nr:MAG: helix-turn-helix domain protein [Microviridae sp.]
MSSHIPALKNRPGAVSRLRGLVLRLGTLSSRDKLVAVALLDVLHLRLFRCCVCQRTLAARLQCSVRTVARALKALREAGILRWRRRRRRASEYRFNMRLVDSSVTAPDGIDRPYRAGGAPLCGRRDVAAEARPEPSRTQRSGALDGGPPVLGRLSAGILAKFGL